MARPAWAPGRFASVSDLNSCSIDSNKGRGLMSILLNRSCQQSYDAFFGHLNF